MTDHLEDLSKCNDIVNAISNSCKRLVKCHDGSILIVNQDAGCDVNHDAERCAESMQGSIEDQTLPRVFTEKFKSDLLSAVYKKCVPSTLTSDRAREALCKSVLPGLTVLRRTIRQRLAELNNDTLTTKNIDCFFDTHLCTNPMCIKDAFKDKNDPNPLPRLNVSHPEWFYFPEDLGYLTKAVAYMKMFLKDPCSRRCALCDIYFKITEGDEEIDLFGLPEQFRLNDSICSLYGKYTLQGPLVKLIIKASGGTDFIVYWGDEIFH